MGRVLLTVGPTPTIMHYQAGKHSDAQPNNNSPPSTLEKSADRAAR